MTATALRSSPSSAAAFAMPRAAEIDTEACPAPKASYSLLRHARKAADTVQTTVAAKGFAARGDDFVGVCLMTHVPYHLIVGRIVDIVERNRDFDRAEARCEMPGVLGALLDDILPQFVAIARQLLDRQSSQVGGGVYSVQIFIFDMCHGYMSQR